MGWSTFMKATAISAAAFWFLGLVFEQSFETLGAAEACFGLCLISALFAIVLSCLAFSLAKKKHAYWLAAAQCLAPFALPLLSSIAGLTMNVHGGDIVMLFLYAVSTELSALLLLTAALRKSADPVQD